MPGVLDRNQVPERYWKDDDWLGIPGGIISPTYFHVLGLRADATDREMIRKQSGVIIARVRPHATNTADPMAQKVANVLLEVISLARDTLSDPKKRAQYTEELRMSYHDAVTRLLVEDRQVRASSEVSRELRDHLLASVREQHSLTQSDATDVLKTVLAEIDKAGKTREGNADPTYPNYFHILNVPETISDDQLSLVAERAEALRQEYELSARSTNRVDKKEMFRRKQKEVEKIAAELTSPARLSEYRRQLREQREAKFQAEVSIRLGDSEYEVPQKIYFTLLDIATDLGLSIEDANAYLTEGMNKEIPVDTGGKKGRLGEVPPIQISVVEGGEVKDFSFHLSNVGGGKLKVRVEPSVRVISIRQTAHTIGPGENVTLTGQVDARSLGPGQHNLAIEVKNSRGYLLRQVSLFVRVPKPNPQLQTGPSLDLGRVLTGQVIRADLSVSNTGTGVLNCRLNVSENITPQRLALAQGQVSVPSGQDVTIPLQVDLRNLAEGNYAGRITIDSNGGTRDVRVTFQAACPQPGSLEVKQTEYNLGEVDPDEVRTFNVVVTNTGDLPLVASVLFTKDTWLSTDVRKFKLDPSETCTLKFSLAILESLENGTPAKEVLGLKVNQGRPGTFRVNVNLVICQKPGPVERIGMATAILPGLILIPGLLSLATYHSWWQSGLFKLAAFAACPIGVAAFDRLWTGRLNSDSEDIGAACWLLVCLHVGAWIADWIGGGIVRGILEVLVSPAVAAHVTGILFGAVLGVVFAYIMMDGAGYKDNIVPVAVALAIGLAISCGIGGGYKGASFAGQRLFYVSMAIAAPIGVGGAFSNKKPQLRLGLARGLSAGGALLTACLILIAFLLTGRARAGGSTPFAGQSMQIETDWENHQAVLDFSGTWQTQPPNYTSITFTQNKNHVTGEYQYGYSASQRGRLEGTVDRGHVSLTWRIGISQGPAEVFRNEEGEYIYRWRYRVGQADRWDGTYTLTHRQKSVSSCCLRISAVPTGATVFLNGYPFDMKTPFVYMRPGHLTIRTEKAGYLPDERRVFLKPGQESVDIALRKARSGSQPAPSERNAAPQAANWAGLWTTQYGQVNLEQADLRVTGQYQTTGQINGTVSGTLLTGKWIRQGRNGDIEFTLAPDGKSFSGRWREGSGGLWSGWNGTRVAVPEQASPPQPAPPSQRESAYTARTSGRVTTVRGSQIFVDLGARDGLRGGSRLTVKLAAHPVKLEGQVIGYKECEVRVVSVQQTTAATEAVERSSEMPSVGDNVSVKSIAGN